MAQDKVKKESQKRARQVSYDIQVYNMTQQQINYISNYVIEFSNALFIRDCKILLRL